jgi:hypothetical protein
MDARVQSVLTAQPPTSYNPLEIEGRQEAAFAFMSLRWNVDRRAIVIGIVVVLLCIIVVGVAVVIMLLNNPSFLGTGEEVTTPPDEEVVLPTPVPLSPEEVAAQMALVEQQVSGLRGLEATGEVAKDFMSESELREEIEVDFEEEYSPEEARDDALVYAAFDFFSPDLDLYALYVDLYSEQIAGFYDPEEKEFFLISTQGRFGSFERLTFAHEYTHALQDQQFDLESYDLEGLSEENPDAALALTALIEGDAQLLTEKYLIDYFASEDRLALFAELDNFDTIVFDSAPAVIQRDLAFPYLEGSRFARALYEQGGWRFVDLAYSDPPTSTEQILHPERYLDGDQPETVTLEPALDALGAGWRLVEESTLGEFHLLLHLEQQIAASDAVPAVEGWGGDRYAVYHHEGSDQIVMVLSVVWDSPGEVDEFMEAYRLFGTARAGRDPTTDRDAVTCWTAQDYLCVAGSGSQTWVASGPNRATLRDVLAVYGIDDN